MHRPVSLPWLALVCAALIATYAGASAWALPCGEAKSATVISRRGANLGVVTADNDATRLRITFAAAEGWTIAKTRAHVVNKPVEFPQSRTGAPILDAFTYQADHAAGVREFSISIPLDEFGVDPDESVYVAAHMIARKFTPRGYVTRYESGWAEGVPFRSRRSRASYFRHVIQRCEDVVSPCCAGAIAPGDFRTQSMGGWGAPARGGNAGTYRDDNFHRWFPNGLTVGYGDVTLRLSDARAVVAFLPQSGHPGALATSHFDPLTTEARELAGQVVALALNVGFDLCDPDFGAGAAALRDLVIADPESELFGMSVGEVLQLANAILGGASTALSPERVNECVCRINENFMDGDWVGDFLCLPQCAHPEPG